jgi:hypothetical protein
MTATQTPAKFVYRVIPAETGSRADVQIMTDTDGDGVYYPVATLCGWSLPLYIGAEELVQEVWQG